MRKSNNSGYTLVFMTLAMVFILGMAALVTDVGLTLYQKEKLESAVDSATLAGMQEISKDDTAVINSVQQYASLNGINPSTLNISINSDRKGISVKSNKNVNYFLARILGINSAVVNTQSNAKTVALTSCTGARPLTIAQQPFVFGQQYTLKEDSGDGLSGNYGALALGGNGASVYGDNLLNGYQNMISVGDAVYTETGNISGTTRQNIDVLVNKDPNSTYINFQRGSPRFIIIPIVNTLDLNGKKPITIVGFAGFFLEGAVNDGGQTAVIGRFVRYEVSGIGSDAQTDYGLEGVQLTN